MERLMKVTRRFKSIIQLIKAIRKIGFKGVNDKLENEELVKKRVMVLGRELRTVVAYPDSEDAIRIRLRVKMDFDIEKMIWMGSPTVYTEDQPICIIPTDI